MSLGMWNTVLFWIAALAVAGATSFMARFIPPPKALTEWSRENGFEVLHFEARLWRRGPFSWRMSARSERVFLIKIKDFQGRTRIGWVRFFHRWGVPDEDVVWMDDNL